MTNIKRYVHYPKREKNSPYMNTHTNGTYGKYNRISCVLHVVFHVPFPPFVEGRAGR